MHHNNLSQTAHSMLCQCKCDKHIETAIINQNYQATDKNIHYSETLWLINGISSITQQTNEDTERGSFQQLA